MSKTYSVTIRDRKNKKGSRRKRSNQKGSKKILLLFFFILICLGAGGYFLYNYAVNCVGDSCNPILGSLAATIEPKLEQDNGMTNILLAGIDTRGENSGLMNTDTIIILTVDYENETTMMTSIPRDLWVKYSLPNGNTTGTKINGAYANGEWQQEGKGMETLQNAVETIIGEPIHYSVKVTLAGFIEMVDAIGGVDIEIPEYYKDAYPASELPPEYQQDCIPFYHGGKYCLFEFFEGSEHMDGQRALIYARSRLLSQRGDFDRAIRQQRVIDSIKEKILSSETYLNPQKIWDIYTIIKENVDTSTFNINDIRAGINLKDTVDVDEIGHVVLDPYLGNAMGKYIHRPVDNPARGYYIIAYDQTYSDIQELLRNIRKYPAIYNEATSISIYNATSVTKLERDWASEIEEDHSLFNIIQTNKVIQNTNNQYSGIVIYKFTEDEKPASEEYLKEFFNVNELTTEVPTGLKNFHGEDYVIVLGTEIVSSQ
ncbi:LCP family protein [Patescibacteria group bacterium]